MFHNPSLADSHIPLYDTLACIIQGVFQTYGSFGILEFLSANF